jgi:hypothetical protein
MKTASRADTLLNFQTWARLAGDAMKTRSHWDRVRLCFMPTGWRPAWLVQAQMPPAGGALNAGWLLVSQAWLGGVLARRPHASGRPLTLPARTST